MAVTLLLGEIISCSELKNAIGKLGVNTKVQLNRYCCYLLLKTALVSPITNTPVIPTQPTDNNGNDRWYQPPRATQMGLSDRYYANILRQSVGRGSRMNLFICPVTYQWPRNGLANRTGIYGFLSVGEWQEMEKSHILQLHSLLWTEMVIIISVTY